MIRKMTKVRIMGPRDRLSRVLIAVQRLGILHLADSPRVEGLRQGALEPADQARRHWLLDRLEDVEAIAGGLRLPSDSGGASRDLGRLGSKTPTRYLVRLRQLVEACDERELGLSLERRQIHRYRALFESFRDVLSNVPEWPNAAAFHVVLHAESGDNLDRLRSALVAEIGNQFVLRSHPLASGEVAVLVLSPSAMRERIDALLAAARLEEVELPQEFTGATLAEALPSMLERLDAIRREEESLERRRLRLMTRYGARVQLDRRRIHDELARLDAMTRSSLTPHAFVLEGWLQSDAFPRFQKGLRRDVGDAVVAEAISEESWRAEDAPVVLSNPRLFRPFELLVRLVPLPRYGSIDPTPFIAVFFPMFFGLILGDIGYGVLLVILALALRWRSEPLSMRRSISEILGACSAFSVIFGLLYGELFGDVGSRWLHLKPLWFSREEAVLPFLALALALGAVHVLLGLGLGAISAFRRDRRLGLGKSLAAVMVLLIIVALLAVLDVLPKAFFGPVVVALLIAFPILVALEGLIAPIELLATVGNVLSYARVMALGTASVMLAVVANRMAGSLGSVAVGVLFALLFHLVNFALGIFSPTIHALRLHYVEFFGKFYSPGGVEYRPLRSWTPSQDQKA